MSILFVIVMLGVIIIHGFVSGLVGAQASDFDDGVTVSVLVAGVTVLAYGFVLEAAWNGQTVGKRLLGIRVLTEAGDEIGAGKALVRNVPAITSLSWLAYLVALVSMAMADRRQRLFDILASTVVVNEKFSAETEPATAPQRGVANDPTGAPDGQGADTHLDAESSGRDDDGWDDSQNDQW